VVCKTNRPYCHTRYLIVRTGYKGDKGGYKGYSQGYNQGYNQGYGQGYGQNYGQGFKGAIPDETSGYICQSLE